MAPVILSGFLTTTAKFNSGQIAYLRATDISAIYPLSGDPACCMIIIRGVPFQCEETADIIAQKVSQAQVVVP